MKKLKNMKKTSNDPNGKWWLFKVGFMMGIALLVFFALIMLSYLY